MTRCTPHTPPHPLKAPLIWLSFGFRPPPPPSPASQHEKSSRHLAFDPPPPTPHPTSHPAPQAVQMRVECTLVRDVLWGHELTEIKVVLKERIDEVPPDDDD